MRILSRLGVHAPVLILLITLIGLSGCSWLPAPIDETADWSAQRLYNEAKTALDADDYEVAIKYYELLESRYPFGRYAQQAQIEVAYAYYQYDEPESAIAAVDRFIKLYPQHPHVDYAYYLRGLVNYNIGSSIMERIFPRDMAERDPGSTRQAFFDFRALVTKFPNSKYAPDALQRMVYLRNTLARHEVLVAEHYMKRKAYVAVVNRTKYVLEHYDRSTAVPRALELMAQAYEAMGQEQLANDTKRVLATSYPDWELRPQKKKAWWNFF